MAALQGSLFDSATEPTLRPIGGGLRRTTLSDGAWIDIVPGWVERADLLYESLVGRVPWRSEERVMYDRKVDVPRLVASYGVGAVLPHRALHEAMERLADHYGGTPGADLATVGLCLYRDGADSVAWHGDRVGRGPTRADTLIAIVSLGCHRRLSLRPRRRDRPALHLELGGGDLVVMGGSCQRTWEHAVPKTARPVGPRLSVQFRPGGVG